MQIDYIIDKKQENNSNYYLVKWTNKQHYYNSWVSEAKLRLQHYHELIRQFEKQQGSQAGSQKSGKKVSIKNSKRIIYKIVKIPNLSINIPTRTKTEPHWLFGDQVEAILERDDHTGKYLVNWSSGVQGWAQEHDILRYESVKACHFFEKILKYHYLNEEASCGNDKDSSHNSLQSRSRRSNRSSRQSYKH